MEQAKEKQCYTYILKGSKDYYYCGIAKDFHMRIMQHNQKKSKSTKYNTPYTLQFLRRFKTRKDARVLEEKIKRAGVKKWYQRNILWGNYPNMVITELIGGTR